MGQQVPACGVVVQTVGEVLDSARDYVRTQVQGFLRRLPSDPSSAKVKLTAFTVAGVRWPALVQANLCLDDHLIRAQTAAGYFQEASHLLRMRLGEQLARLASSGTPRPWPAPTHRVQRPEFADLPGQDREIVRRKAFALRRCTPDQAALTMDLMDYDFHLFIDAETGQDSVICRVGPTGYRLARLASMAPPSTPVTVPLTIDVHPVQTLTPAEAVQRLNATELPFRFLRDPDTGRGAVVYRRYDGHYGLIAPVG